MVSKCTTRCLDTKKLDQVVAKSSSPPSPLFSTSGHFIFLASYSQTCCGFASISDWLLIRCCTKAEHPPTFVKQQNTKEKLTQKMSGHQRLLELLVVWTHSEALKCMSMQLRKKKVCSPSTLSFIVHITVPHKLMNITVKRNLSFSYNIPSAAFNTRKRRWENNNVI